MEQVSDEKDGPGEILLASFLCEVLSQLPFSSGPTHKSWLRQLPAIGGLFHFFSIPTCRLPIFFFFLAGLCSAACGILVP